MLRWGPKACATQQECFLPAEERKRQILVVEDDRQTRRLLERQLELAGYAVRSCADGRAALEAITAMGSGIVVADWGLPDMDGPELCRAVRELLDLQALGHIYFLLLSAQNAKDQVVAGLEAGANDYLTKPYHRGELLARIQAGDRILRLQEELLHRTVELQKANAQMAVLANRLQELANTDPLTRLANRRWLFRRLEELWHSAESTTVALSCIMLDLDNFKRINDQHGHQAGDHVLRCTADVIRRCAASAELCGRFGGEEFLMVCPALPLASAAELAEHVRVTIAGQTVIWEEQTIVATVSCGVAAANAGAGTPDDLVRQADAMLYAAKQHGRNQTWVYLPNGEARRAGSSEAPASVVPVSRGPHSPSRTCRARIG